MPDRCLFTSLQQDYQFIYATKVTVSHTLVLLTVKYSPHLFRTSGFTVTETWISTRGTGDSRRKDRAATEDRFNAPHANLHVHLRVSVHPPRTLLMAAVPGIPHHAR